MELIRPETLTLPAEHWFLLSPYLAVFLCVCVAILAGTAPLKYNPDKMVAGLCGFGLLLGAFFSISLVVYPTVSLFQGMMVSDPFAHFLNFIYCLLGAIVLLSSYQYLHDQKLRFIEFDILLMFSVLGMMLMTSTQHLVVLFLALELMSLTVYVLVGFRRADKRSNEAALKYFILGGAGSAVLLYGIALVYGNTMSFNLQEVLSRVQQNVSMFNPALLLGAVLLLVGFLFKTATVPFHMWMPDVYEGAPMPVTSFMTGALKFSVFAAFVRVLLGLDFNVSGVENWNSTLQNTLWVCAAVTMFVGNLIALLQTNLKRMLAYSSIAHTGYLLVGVLAGTFTRESFSGVLFYLVVYALMNVGAFSVLSSLAGPGDSKMDLEDVGGLASKKPWLTFALSVFLFSMAGIPPTGGFFSKYVLFYSGVQVGAVWLVVLGVLCSAVSVYFYLRVIVYMYMRPAAVAAVPAAALSVNWGLKIAIALTLGLVLLLGVLPNLLLEMVRTFFA
jgi:NADH-quinone oxidoreductase subunit N